MDSTWWEKKTTLHEQNSYRKIKPKPYFFRISISNLEMEGECESHSYKCKELNNKLMFSLKKWKEQVHIQLNGYSKRLIGDTVKIQ